MHIFSTPTDLIEPFEEIELQTFASAVLLVLQMFESLCCGRSFAVKLVDQCNRHKYVKNRI